MESRRFVYLPAAIFITEDLFDDKFDVTKLVILSTFFTAGQWDRHPGETCRTFAKFTGFVRQTDGFRKDCTVPVLLVIELRFLHLALPLMAVYQCIKFHLIPLYTFRDMLRTSFLCSGQAFYCKN